MNTMSDSKTYKKKVKNLTRSITNYQYIAIGEINYGYASPTKTGGKSTINESIMTSFTKIKQDYKGNGENRILVVVRNKTENKIQLILLKRPPSSTKHWNMEDPLRCCDVDSNLKTNQENNILESLKIRIEAQDGNTFLLEDPNYNKGNNKFAAAISCRTIFKIQVKNTMRKAPKNGYSGRKLCDVLTYMSENHGNVPPQNSPSSANTNTNTSNPSLNETWKESPNEECNEMEDMKSSVSSESQSPSISTHDTSTIPDTIECKDDILDANTVVAIPTA
jgi:hypothetical protein